MSRLRALKICAPEKARENEPLNGVVLVLVANGSFCLPALHAQKRDMEEETNGFHYSQHYSDGEYEYRYEQRI